MRRRQAILRAVATVYILGVALAGCSGPGPYSPSPKPPAAHPVLTFGLSAIDIVDETAGATTDPGLIGSFSVPPQQAIRRWAAERLQVTGGEPGILRFRITAAGAVRTPLEKTPGVSGWFTRDQEELVTVVFAAHLEARRNDGGLIAAATSRAEASRSFVEKIKPPDRRAGLDALIATALASFDRELEARVRAEMPDLLQ